MKAIEKNEGLAERETEQSGKRKRDAMKERKVKKCKGSK